jgi:HlyD family secretion protein
MRKKTKLTRKQKIVRIVGILAVLGLVAAVVIQVGGRGRQTGGEANAYRTAVVERRDITSSLSSSGTLSPKDTYSITSLVSGEVISADFEEGDQVQEGQILYVMDTSSMETELNSAQSSVERAQDSYILAAQDYEEALGDYSQNTYKSTETGYIKTLHVKAGDKVNANTQIADIYNDKVMKLRVPFLSVNAAGIGVGNQGVITLTHTGEQLLGTVTSVSNMEETMAGGRLVRYVTLQVENPGGLTTDMKATVQIGDFYCAQEGSFTPILDTVMGAEVGSTVEIASMLVSEGDYVSKGTPLFRMTDKTADNLVRSYKEAVDKAQENLESAQSKLETTQDNIENYTITAPISGQVITKSVKSGDKVSSGGNAAVTMAVIYDLSELTFEMSVDELDIQSVKAGQTVEVTADAFEGQTFTGKVTNISLASSYSNGVTNYPVTVTLDEVGELLPGMNVDGEIILEQTQGTLVVPVDSLMRGNRVYVKDDTVTEKEGNVPAGFRAVEVETGLMNDDFVEIVSGLSEGEEVYVAESSVSSGFPMMPGGMNQGQGPNRGSGQGGNRGGGAPQGGPGNGRP